MTSVSRFLTQKLRLKVNERSSGRRRFADGPLAHVRTPGGPTGPAQSLLRLTRSSPTPRLRPSLTQSNRRGTDPYARWWGRGGIARCPPIPIQLPRRSPTAISPIAASGAARANVRNSGMAGGVPAKGNDLGECAAFCRDIHCCGRLSRGTVGAIELIPPGFKLYH